MLSSLQFAQIKSNVMLIKKSIVVFFFIVSNQLFCDELIEIANDFIDHEILIHKQNLEIEKNIVVRDIYLAQLEFLNYLKSSDDRVMKFKYVIPNMLERRKYHLHNAEKKDNRKSRTSNGYFSLSKSELLDLAMKLKLAISKMRNENSK